MLSEGERLTWAKHFLKLPGGLEQGRGVVAATWKAKLPLRKITVPFTLGSPLPSTVKGAGDKGLLATVSDCRPWGGGRASFIMFMVLAWRLWLWACSLGKLLMAVCQVGAGGGSVCRGDEGRAEGGERREEKGEGENQGECINAKPWLQDCFFDFKERIEDYFKERKLLEQK